MSYLQATYEIRRLERLYKGDATAQAERARELHRTATSDLHRLVDPAYAMLIYGMLPRPDDDTPDPFALNKPAKPHMDWTNAPIKMTILSKNRSIASTLTMYLKPNEFAFSYTGQRTRADVASIPTVAGISVINSDLFERLVTASMNSNEIQNYVGRPLGVQYETRLLDTAKGEVIDEHATVTLTVAKWARMLNVWCGSSVPPEMRPRGPASAGMSLYLVLKKVVDHRYTEEKERSEILLKSQIAAVKPMDAPPPDLEEEIRRIMGDTKSPVSSSSSDTTTATTATDTATGVGGGGGGGGGEQYPKPGSNMPPPPGSDPNLDRKYSKPPTTFSRHHAPTLLPTLTGKKRSRHQIQDALRASRLLERVGKASEEINRQQAVLMRHRRGPMTGNRAGTSNVSIASAARTGVKHQSQRRMTEASVALPSVNDEHDPEATARMKRTRVFETNSTTNVMVRTMRPGNLIWQLVPYVTLGEVPCVPEASSLGYTPTIIHVGTVHSCDPCDTDPLIVDQFLYPKTMDSIKFIGEISIVDVLLDVRVCH